MSSVPNIKGIKLSDVTAVVGGSSLNGAFANSLDRCFNSTYKGSKNRLSNFRDYDTMRGALNIGDNYAGGIIFWLDNTGQHGLVAHANDIPALLRWSNGSNFVTGATGENIGTGQANTTHIIGDQGAGNYAAYQAYYWPNVPGYYDWFLPSKWELVEMRTLYNMGLGSFTDGAYYASSTETGTNSFFSYQFNTTYGYNSAKQDYVYTVRPIRAF